MKLRQKPAVLRFHKVKQEKDAEKFWFSEAMLYVPHIDEEDLVAQIDKAKLNQETWEKFTHEISLVKSQVMEHLAENELARLMAEELVIDNEKTGENLNPEVEQELDDNQLDVYEPIPDLAQLDPDQFKAYEDKEQRGKSFKHIEVRPLNVLNVMVRQLHYYQRKILDIATQHARNLVKARSQYCSLPKPPLLMVDGAAGSGKSHVISIIR